MKLILIITFTFLVLLKESQASSHRDNVTTFYLYSDENKVNPDILIAGNLTSLHNSHFSCSKPTRVLIHDFLDWQSNTPMQTLKNTLLSKRKENVIIVGWDSEGCAKKYPLARYRINAVAALLSNLIDFLNDKGKLKVCDLGIIGAGLGAHIAGIAGSKMDCGKPKFIIGLDPTLAYFFEEIEEDRLDKNDAEYVEVIHTNNYLQGIGINCGDVDFVVNGGTIQPICWSEYDPYFAHKRALKLYTESVIDTTSKFCGKKDNGHKAYMGGDPSNADKGLSGVYQVQTNKCSLYAKDCCDD